MGAKTWMIVQAEQEVRGILAARPVLDETATAAFVASLFPGKTFELCGRGDWSDTSPRDGELVAGCYPGLRVAAHKDFARDRLSQTPAHLIAPRGATYAHAMHSVVDWCAYAIWRDGTLERALSVAPDNGVIENIGSPLPFEEPFWRGDHPAVEPDEKADDYPLPFHPLDLGEAALRALFGYQLEGFVDATLLEHASIPLLHFKPQKPRWQFWRAG